MLRLFLGGRGGRRLENGLTTIRGLITILERGKKMEGGEESGRWRRDGRDWNFGVGSFVRGMSNADSGSFRLIQLGTGFNGIALARLSHVTREPGYYDCSYVSRHDNVISCWSRWARKWIFRYSHRCRFMLESGERWMAKFVDIFIVRCYLLYKDRENEYLKGLISFEICDIGNIIKF